jgi:hypothetical protein
LDLGIIRFLEVDLNLKVEKNRGLDKRLKKNNI